MTRPILSRRTVLTAGTAALVLPVALAWPRPSLAGTPPVFSARGAAINGYDPVAYVTEGAPVRGEAAFTTMWNGAEWRFSSAKTQAMFEGDPGKYAPQYGGYCAFAVANGYTAKTDPDAWSVVDGKLYLNFNRRIRSRWLRDVAGNIAAGDANWPRVLDA